jgi:peptidyl-prolyl cis-trans isomerase B (cyclophilin B)
VAAVVGAASCSKHDEPEAPLAVAETTASQKATKDQLPAPFDGADPLHQPFAAAVRTCDDPPPGVDMPPNETMTGKRTFKILQQVQDSWESIRYRTAESNATAYTAVLDTDAGVIEIELRPDVAPNHVRSFVALARAGYYDGLAFDRVQFQESVVGAEGDPPIRLEQIEAGNPQGTGPLNGSVGYWLRPEFGDKLLHEPGTVGACLEGAPDAEGRAVPDSAGCRFYITLTKDPLLDGNYTAFGKVKTGLDVARRIYQQPVASEDRERDGLRRLEKHVVIKKVTIHTRPAEGAK